MKFFPGGGLCRRALCLWLLTFFLAGCSGPPAPRESGLFFDGADDLGHPVKLAKKPVRVLSMNLPTDELLLALAPPEHIAALSRHSRVPGHSICAPLAQKLPYIHERSPEAVLAMKPDLVLSTDGMGREAAAALREMGIPVFASKNPQTIEEVFKRIDVLGSLLGEQERAAKLAKELRAHLARVEERVGDIKPEEEAVVVAFGYTGAFGRRGCLFDSVCRAAHIKNGAADAAGETRTSISKEEVIAINPDVIFMPDFGDGRKNDPSVYRERFVNDPAYRELKAVKNGRLVLVADRYRYSASQNAVYAVGAFARAVYPERFSDWPDDIDPFAGNGIKPTSQE